MRVEAPGRQCTAAVAATGAVDDPRKEHVMTRLIKIAFAALAPALLYFPASDVGAQENPAGLGQYVSTTEPEEFDDPDEALTALREALAANDVDRVATLLGLDAAKLKAGEGVMDAFSMIREGAARRLALESDGERRIVEVGDMLWPLPFPLVKTPGNKWAFDTEAGIEEIANRRVGENELETIATLRAYVDAQEDYALDDHDGDGVLEYAQKFISAPGGTDGLYWPDDQGDGPSPAGDLRQSEIDRAAEGKGYFGYRFKILTRQGSNIAGGAYDYVINGNMIAGFAVVAWPVVYGETGIHTFVVNRNGIVYQADLGQDTERLAADIRQFNPNDNWVVTGD